MLTNAHKHLSKFDTCGVCGGFAGTEMRMT